MFFIYCFYLLFQPLFKGFLKLGQKYKNIFVGFFGSNKNFKICFRDLLTFSSRNIILRFACSPQCKFCWIYRLLFDEINGLSIYQKITCDKWVLSPKGHCQHYSQEVSNLIPKSPSHLAIISSYYFNYTIIPD